MRVQVFMARCLVVIMVICAPLGAVAASGDGVLRVGWSQEPRTLNTMGYDTVQATMILRSMLYETMLRYDEDLNPAPMLATSWKVSDDGLVWTFRITDKAAWHDGKALTSEDIAFTYQYILEHKIPNFINYLKHIDTIETPRPGHRRAQVQGAHRLHRLRSVQCLHRAQTQVGVHTGQGRRPVRRQDPPGVRPLHLRILEEERPHDLQGQQGLLEGDARTEPCRVHLFRLPRPHDHVPQEGRHRCHRLGADPACRPGSQEGQGRQGHQGAEPLLPSHLHQLLDLRQGQSGPAGPQGQTRPHYGGEQGPPGQDDPHGVCPGGDEPRDGGDSLFHQQGHKAVRVRPGRGPRPCWTRRGGKTPTGTGYETRTARPLPSNSWSSPGGRRRCAQPR